MPHFFITGTDTGVGKTWFTCWLVRAWRARGHAAAGLKPIAAGDRDDAELLARRRRRRALPRRNQPGPSARTRRAAHRRARGKPHDRFSRRSTPPSPRQRRASRTSPSRASAAGACRSRRIIEVRDWARDLGLPVVVVARAGLGTLNHTLLTVESIRAAGVRCAGVVLNFGAPEAGREIRARPAHQRGNPAGSPASSGF